MVTHFSIELLIIHTKTDEGLPHLNKLTEQTN